MGWLIVTQTFSPSCKRLLRSSRVAGNHALLCFPFSLSFIRKFSVYHMPCASWVLRGTSMNKQKSALMEFIIIVVLLSCPVSRQYLTADHYFCLFRKWSSLVHPSVRLLVPVVDNQNRKPGQSRASVLYKPCREQRMPPQQILCWRRKLLHCTQSRHNILFK